MIHGLKNKIQTALTALFILSAAFMISCEKSAFYDRSADISEKGWQEDSVKVFDDVTVDDTVSPFDFYISVRNTTDYRYSNLYIFLHTALPGGRSTVDTLELILADSKGKWYGKGFGHIRDNRILIRKDLKFPRKGKYRFGIQQAMRQNDHVLEGIKSIGIRIERSN